MSALLAPSVDTPIPAAAPRRGELPTASNVFEPAWIRVTLIVVALSFLALFLFVPLVAVFAEAFKKGWHTYLEAIVDPDAVSAIKLTVITAAIAVPLNLVFGVAASWCIAKFEFRGKSCLLYTSPSPRDRQKSRMPSSA